MTRKPELMTRRERHAYVAKLVEWWDAEVGERPENLEAVLGMFLTNAPADYVRQALEGAAADESLEDSDAVLEAVRGRVRKYLREFRKAQEEKTAKKREGRAAAKKPQ